MKAPCGIVPTFTQAGRNGDQKKKGANSHAFLRYSTKANKMVEREKRLEDVKTLLKIMLSETKKADFEAAPQVALRAVQTLLVWHSFWTKRLILQQMCHVQTQDDVLQSRFLFECLLVCISIFINVHVLPQACEGLDFITKLLKSQKLDSVSWMSDDATYLTACLGIAWPLAALVRGHFK